MLSRSALYQHKANSAGVGKMHAILAESSHNEISINLLPTVSHYSGFCKQVYLPTAGDEISRIGTKFIWFERALQV